MKSILITGCNRGLGLGLVKHLVCSKRPPEYIFATCRDASKATKLRELAEKSNNVYIIELDVTDTNSYQKVVDIVSEKVGDKGLNVLFNNAGIFPNFSHFGPVKEEPFTDTFCINTIAPIMLSEAFLPLLNAAAQNYDDKKSMSVNKAAIINMSALFASITEMNSGGYYSYRCSKAALNAATKAMSIDFEKDGILVVCIHPGWVQTDMGGTNAPMDVDNSISGILNVMQSLSEKHTGCFLQYDGKTLPW